MSAYWDERRRTIRVVPTVSTLRDAFAADVIDMDELERLLAAAVAETRVEIPERLYRWMRGGQEVTDTPGEIIAYSAPAFADPLVGARVAIERLRAMGY